MSYDEGEGRQRTGMSPTLSLALEVAAEIESFPLGKCGPSDDPDMQTAYLYGFRDIAKRFLAAAKRIGDPDLSELIVGLDPSPEYNTDAYDLKGDLIGVIDYLREVAKNPEYEIGVTNNSAFLDQGIVSQLKSIKPPPYDFIKFARFCEELNDAYRRGNYLSCTLLIRAVMNHVPPIFGVQNFNQVVANSSRSIKAVLSRLEDEARPVADLPTHMLIRFKESIPTKHQSSHIKQVLRFSFRKYWLRANRLASVQRPQLL
jgi:hypothetical protein